MISLSELQSCVDEGDEGASEATGAWPDESVEESYLYGALLERYALILYFVLCTLYFVLERYTLIRPLGTEEVRAGVGRR